MCGNPLHAPRCLETASLLLARRLLSLQRGACAPKTAQERRETERAPERVRPCTQPGFGTRQRASTSEASVSARPPERPRVLARGSSPSDAVGRGRPHYAASVRSERGRRGASWTLQNCPSCGAAARGGSWSDEEAPRYARSRRKLLRWLPQRRSVSSSASGRAPVAQAMLRGYYYKPSGAGGAEQERRALCVRTKAENSAAHGSTLPSSLVSFCTVPKRNHVEACGRSTHVKASAGCGAYHGSWVLD